MSQLKCCEKAILKATRKKKKKLITYKGTAMSLIANVSEMTNEESEERKDELREIRGQ
jgi:hypothetical protein